MRNRNIYALKTCNKLLLVAANWVALSVMLLVVLCPAKSQPAAGAKQTFDVASVKPAAPLVAVDNNPRLVSAGRGGRIGGFSTDPQKFTSTYTTLKGLVIYAFRVANYQISGGPSWLDSEPYDIEAKTDRPTDPEQFRLMLQTLLADRFKLTYHRETKQVSIYALVLDKGGPKFQALKSAESPSTGPFSFKDLPSLAKLLSNYCDRPVVDQTGLQGSFDLKLDMNKEREREREAMPSGDNAGFPHENTIVAAAKDQFGLKFVPARGPVEMLVIDHAEKPGAN
jgi:uncharacterized protein (TIGR03435 family)